MSFKVGDRVVVKSGVTYQNCNHGNYKANDVGTITNFMWGFFCAFVLTMLAFSVILTTAFVPVSLFENGAFYYKQRLYKLCRVK